MVFRMVLRIIFKIGIDLMGLYGYSVGVGLMMNFRR